MAVGLNFRTPAEPMSAYQRPSNAVPSNVRRVANLHKPSMFTVAMALLNQHDSGGLQVHRKLVGGRPTSASEPDRRASVWSADVTPANTGWEPSVYVGDCGLIHESRPLKGLFPVRQVRICLLMRVVASVGCEYLATTRWLRPLNRRFGAVAVEERPAAHRWWSCSRKKVPPLACRNV